MQYERQPRKKSTTIEESQTIKRESKKLWLKKQVAKRKGIPLESPLGIALSEEEGAKSSQEVTPSKSPKAKAKAKNCPSQSLQRKGFFGVEQLNSSNKAKKL